MAWEVYRADWAGARIQWWWSRTRRVPRASNSSRILDCSTQRAARPPQDHEVVLDQADGLGLAHPPQVRLHLCGASGELKELRGNVMPEDAARSSASSSAPTAGMSSSSGAC